MIRLTPVVKAILIINVVLFIAQSFAPPADFSYCFGAPANYPAAERDIVTGYLAMYGLGTDCFKPFQLFTYMFLHGGFAHVFFNMFGLVSIGPILETYWGQKRFTLFYVVTGMGAAIFNILLGMFFPAAAFGTLLGASGAIYGLLTAFGMTFPEMEVRLMIPPIPIKAKYLVFVLGGITFFFGPQNTAHFAHLGGVIFAFAMIMIWRNQGMR
jgi:membrane associated rhomboid family serine protease